MGFPEFPDLAAANGLGPDQVTLRAPTYAIGNAMHVASVGAILIVALAATEGPGRKHGLEPGMASTQAPKRPRLDGAMQSRMC